MTDLREIEIPLLLESLHLSHRLLNLVLQIGHKFLRIPPG